MKFDVIFSVFSFFSAFGERTVCAASVGMDPYFRRDYQFNIHQNAFYKLHPEPSKWTDAISICDGEGSHLAVPETAAEAKVIVGVMKDDQQSNDISEVYVGIHDLFMDGVFVTVDGTDVKELWSDWASESDYLSDGCDCGILLLEGKLAKKNCSTRHAFVCKKTLKLNPCGTADEEYFPNLSNDTCYKMHQQEVNWTEAYAICYAERSYLAVLNSEDEAKMLVDKFPMDNDLRESTRNWNSENFKTNEMIWLGFHDKFTIGKYVTVKRYPLSESGYKEWYQNSDSSKILNGNNCGGMYPDQKLGVSHCNDKRKLGFICERDLYTKIGARHF